MLCPIVIEQHLRVLKSVKYAYHGLKHYKLKMSLTQYDSEIVNIKTPGWGFILVTIVTVGVCPLNCTTCIEISLALCSFFVAYGEKVNMG